MKKRRMTKWQNDIDESEVFFFAAIKYIIRFIDILSAVETFEFLNLESCLHQASNFVK